MSLTYFPQKITRIIIFLEGFKEAAEKFGSETGICYPYNLESLNERIKIREALEVGDIEKAINKINSLHPELIDTNRPLAFHLRVIHIYDQNYSIITYD